MSTNEANRDEPQQPHDEGRGTVPLDKGRGQQSHGAETGFSGGSSGAGSSATTPIPQGTQPMPQQAPQWQPPQPSGGPMGGPAGAAYPPMGTAAVGGPINPTSGPAPARTGVSFLTLCLVELRRLWMRRMTKWVSVVALFFASLTWLLPMLFGLHLPDDAPFVPFWTAISATAVIIVSGFMSLIAASFIAAEFATGSMSSWLTFEPRRIRVAASKFVALVVGTLVLMAVAMVISALGTVAIGATAGGSTSVGTSEVGFEISPGWAYVRLVILGVFAVLATACVALVIRNTAGTIGSFILWSAIVEGFIAAAISQGHLLKFLPWTNATAFVTGGVHYQVGGGDSGYYSSRYTAPSYDEVSLTAASIYLVLLATLLVGGSIAIFNKRDVN